MKDSGKKETEDMTTLIILNHAPYDGSDLTWNALRLAGQLKKDEAEVRQVFADTLKVRSLGEEARKLADQYFFETLVRVHRAGEGEPFTGLKPQGTTDPALVAADKALAEGSISELSSGIFESAQT